MFHATEILPAAECAARHDRCRELVRRHCPSAGGLLVFSRTSVYYLSGTMGNGVLWLPLDGDPALMVRKGVERCRLESPLRHIYEYRSYGDLAGLCAKTGAPFTPVMAAQMEALPWDKANLLQAKLTGHTFVPGDVVLQQARAVKSPWEMAKMRHAAQMHAAALYAELPTHIHAGQDEAHIARLWWDIALQKGHMGMARMEGFGNETFLGKIAAGKSAHYALPFLGPTGNEGMHPATPFGGNVKNIWGKNTPMQIDTSFVYEGYHSDMSATFWAGPADSVPDEASRAQACCVQILHELQKGLLPSASTAQLWNMAQDMARAAGFEAGFMGRGEKKVAFVGHGIGLAQAEWPYIGANDDTPLEEGMTLALEPKISVEQGMMGTECVFTVTAQGGEPLADAPATLVCLPE